MKFLRQPGDKHYDRQRLTDCCGVFSTYTGDGDLVCKKCYGDVEPGEGDGSAYLGTDGVSVTLRPSVHTVRLSNTPEVTHVTGPQTIYLADTVEWVEH